MITTIDGAVAGAQPPQFYQKNGITMSGIGRYHDLMFGTGLPGAASNPSAGINGAALTSPRAGYLPFTNPVSGESRLLRFSAQSSQIGTMMLIDRLWENSGLSVTSTTAQSITPAALPARDQNGTTLGEGVYAALEVIGVTTTANTAATITYTDSDGNTGNTGSFGATAPNSLLASAPIGTWAPFALAAGDRGVRSIQSYNNGTTLTSGTISLVLYRILASVGIGAAYKEEPLDYVTGGAVKLYDNTVPQLLWIPSVTTAIQPSGVFAYTQG